jgi:hypothetical protein
MAKPTGLWGIIITVLVGNEPLRVPTKRTNAAGRICSHNVAGLTFIKNYGIIVLTPLCSFDFIKNFCYNIKKRQKFNAITPGNQEKRVII